MAVGFPQSECSKTKQGRSHNVFIEVGGHTSFLQYFIGFTGQSYSLWEETTQGINIRRQETLRTVSESGYNMSSALHLWIHVSNIPPSLKYLSQGQLHNNSIF